MMQCSTCCTALTRRDEPKSKHKFVCIIIILYTNGQTIDECDIHLRICEEASQAFGIWHRWRSVDDDLGQCGILCCLQLYCTYSTESYRGR